jgi:hypothetical protein
LGAQTESLDDLDCDQVALIPGKRVKDFNNYLDQGEAFFTMNAMWVHMLETNNPDKVLDAVAVSHMKEPPRVLQGTVTCLLFEDDVVHTKIPMCLKDVATMQKVKAAYNKLMFCRARQMNSAKQPKLDESYNVGNILKSVCAGKDVTKYNITNIKQILSEELTNSGVNNFNI